MGENKSAIRIWWVLRQVWRVLKVVQRHGGQHRDDDVVVADVEVELFTKREVCRVVGQARVDAAVGARDILVGQPSLEFLQVTNTLGLYPRLA